MELEYFKDKQVRLVQKSGHVKFGVLKGYTDKFILLLWSDGNIKAISQDNIDKIELLHKEHGQP